MKSVRAPARSSGPTRLRMLTRVAWADPRPPNQSLGAATSSMDVAPAFEEDPAARRHPWRGAPRGDVEIRRPGALAGYPHGVALPSHGSRGQAAFARGWCVPCPTAAAGRKARVESRARPPDAPCMLRRVRRCRRSGGAQRPGAPAGYPHGVALLGRAVPRRPLLCFSSETSPRRARRRAETRSPDGLSASRCTPES